MNNANIKFPPETQPVDSCGTRCGLDSGDSELLFSPFLNSPLLLFFLFLFCCFYDFLKYCDLSYWLAHNGECSGSGEPSPRSISG